MPSTTRVLTINGQVTPAPPLTGHLKMGGCNPRGCHIEVNSRYLLQNGQPWMPVMAVSV
ncbi:MAG: hypothetical protein JXM69_08180 [Anaerolineae bacterium]|nr:hypothetical protein [Anaerolineae bacterium]